MDRPEPAYVSQTLTGAFIGPSRRLRTIAESTLDERGAGRADREARLPGVLILVYLLDGLPGHGAAGIASRTAC